MAKRKNWPALTLDRLKELLSYDPSTGEWIWNVARGSAIKGAPCNLIGSVGYVVITVDGKGWTGHRLAWFYQTGEVPTCEIDHINGNRADNRFSNLRKATSSQNKCNTGMRPCNTSGFKGVSFNKGAKKWTAKCRHNGKQFHIGYFETAEAASDAYCAFAKRVHGEFFFSEAAAGECDAV